MGDDPRDDEYTLVLASTLRAHVQVFFASDTATGQPCFALSLHTPDGTPWPWGDTEPLVIALNRVAMAAFLGDVVDVAERVYSAAHGEDDDGSGA